MSERPDQLGEEPIPADAHDLAVATEHDCAQRRLVQEDSLDFEDGQFGGDRDPPVWQFA